jgi:biopolymer transport protein ExbD
MAMNVGPAAGSDEDELNASINTTPLVDVMLVLLIIFLITIPVVTHTVPLSLPQETNQPNQTKPEDVTIAVNVEGEVFWNEQLVPDNGALLSRLKEAALRQPQPIVHIRADRRTRYKAVGQVVFDCQRAGIAKVGFVTEPPPRA